MKKSQIQLLQDRLATGQPLSAVEGLELGVSPSGFHSKLTQIGRRLEGTGKQIFSEWRKSNGKRYMVYWIGEVK